MAITGNCNAGIIEIKKGIIRTGAACGRSDGRDDTDVFVKDISTFAIGVPCSRRRKYDSGTRGTGRTLRLYNIDFRECRGRHIEGCENFSQRIALDSLGCGICRTAGTKEDNREEQRKEILYE